MSKTPRSESRFRPPDLLPMSPDALRRFADRTESCLNRWPAWQALVATVAAALLLNVFFFSPKFQLWDFTIEGSYETTRARAFLAQCADPFTPVDDRAMQWRLLPPLVCHVLHLGPRASLAVPWVGVVFLLTSAATILHQRGLSRLQAALATALMATTSAVIVPMMWLGVNDAWVWAALLWVAFGRSRWTLILGCLLAPWIDERFIIGFPLAFCLRQLVPKDGGAPPRPLLFLRDLFLATLWLLPYAVVRLWLSQRGEDQSGALLTSHLTGFLTWMPITPLAWWMAFRVGWVPMLFAAATLRHPPFAAAPMLTAATLLVMMILAADLSRSSAIVLPMFIAGTILAVKKFPTWATAGLAGLLATNLALPALHVVYTKVDLISPLPIEVYRVLRKM